MDQKTHHENILTEFNTEVLTNNDPYFLYLKFKTLSHHKKYKIFIFLSKKYDILSEYQKFIVIFTIFLNNFIELFKKILSKHVFNPFIEYKKYNKLSLIKYIIDFEDIELIDVYKDFLINDNLLLQLLSNLASNNEVLSFNELKIKKCHIIYLFKIAFYTNNCYIISLILKHPLYTELNDEIIDGLSCCYDLLKSVKYASYQNDNNFIFKHEFVYYIIEIRNIYIFNILFNNFFDSIVDFIEYNDEINPNNINSEVGKYLVMYDSLYNIHLEYYEELKKEKYISDYSNNVY
jgi:hypothetical protein